MSEHESTTHGHVKITRYKVDGVEKRTGYVGTIEPEHDETQWPSWIIFLRADNSGTLYLDREADGAVVGPGLELPAQARPRRLEADILEVDAWPPRVSVSIAQMTVHIHAGGSQNRLDGSQGEGDPAGADGLGVAATSTAAG